MRGYECGFDLAIGQSCGCRRPLSRESLATWNTPEPDSLDSAAGVMKLSQEDSHIVFTDPATHRARGAAPRVGNG